MEADWEIEIDKAGPTHRCVLAKGFVDLRSSPEQVRELSEVRQLAAPGEQCFWLGSMRAASPSLWTGEVRQRLSSVDESDSFELDAPEKTAPFATLECYVDLLPVAMSNGQNRKPRSNFAVRSLCVFVDHQSVAVAWTSTSARCDASCMRWQQLGITARPRGCQ